MNSEIVPKSAIKKRKTPIEAYKDAYEKPNPQVESGFSRRSRKIHRGSKLSQIEIMPEFALEDFQAEHPTTAIATIPSRSMSATAQALPSKQKQGSVSKVSPHEISVSKPRSAKSRRNYKKLFNDIENIQDAKFTEDFDEETPELAVINTPKIKSLAAGKKQEPASIKMISAQKAKTKSQLAKVEPDENTPEFVSDGFRIEPKKARNNKVNDRWLIDKAADELYNTVNIVGKVVGKAAKEGYKATRTGIKAINEISEDIVANPILQNIAKNVSKQHDATMQGMAAGARRARGSILAAGNNSRKRNMTAGSLVTTHSVSTNTGAGTTAAIVGIQRVFPKIVHRKGGDIVKYFSAAGIEISAAQARRILGNAPLPTVPTGNRTVATYQTDPGIRGVINPVVPNPLGTQRRQGNPIGEITRATHPSGLVRRAKNPVGVVQNAVQNSYTPTGAINTATTATKIVKNPIGFVQQNHSPVVDISKVVTPSRLLYRHMGA